MTTVITTFDALKPGGSRFVIHYTSVSDKRSKGILLQIHLICWKKWQFHFREGTHRSSKSVDKEKKTMVNYWRTSVLGFSTGKKALELDATFTERVYFLLPTAMKMVCLFGFTKYLSLSGTQ
jgi:hypothetical protein